MPITPNNFKVTDAIGETDNYIGADVQFFHITLVSDDSSVVDLRTELGFDETVHNMTVRHMVEINQRSEKIRDLQRRALHEAKARGLHRDAGCAGERRERERAARGVLCVEV